MPFKHMRTMVVPPTLPLKNLMSIINIINETLDEAITPGKKNSLSEFQCFMEARKSNAPDCFNVWVCVQDVLCQTS